MWFLIIEMSVFSWIICPFCSLFVFHSHHTIHRIGYSFYSLCWVIYYKLILFYNISCIMMVGFATLRLLDFLHRLIVVMNLMVNLLVILEHLYK